MPTPAQIQCNANTPERQKVPKPRAAQASRLAKTLTIPQTRGELVRSLYEATTRLRAELKSCEDARLIQSLAVAVGILTDKLVLLDVRCEQRQNLDVADLDEIRARQQAVDEEIARRKAELMRKGATDTVEVTPALLAALDSPPDQDQSSDE